MWTRSHANCNLVITTQCHRLPSSTAHFHHQIDIRLLRLHDITRLPNCQDPAIALSFETVKPQESPPFDALSYTSGDPLCRELATLLLPAKKDRPPMVVCDGAETPI